VKREEQDDDEFSSLHWRRSSGRLTDPQSAMNCLHRSPELQGSSSCSLPPQSKVSEKRTQRQRESRDPRKSPSCSLLIVEKPTDLACRHHPSSIECQVARVNRLLCADLALICDLIFGTGSGLVYLYMWRGVKCAAS
jgi:hypothetical protein